MPELDLGPAIEAAAKAMFVATRGANMYYNPPSWSEISTSNQESWRYSASKAIEAALPELRKAIAEELKPDHVAVVHALTHAVDKLATAKAALREILHAHGGCMAPVMAEQWRAVLADLDAEPQCVRGQSGGGE